MSATSVAGPQELLLQLLDPANRANPYAVYERFRERGPLQMPDSNLTIFSSFRDCDEALRHPLASVDRQKSTMVQRWVDDGSTQRPQGPPMFLFLDPPDHTRLRRLVSKAFVPKVVNELTPHITELVDGLLDRAAQQGRFDAVTGLSYPLPVTVIWANNSPLHRVPRHRLNNILTFWFGDIETPPFHRRVNAKGRD